MRGKKGKENEIMVVVSSDTSVLMHALGLSKVILHTTFSIPTYESLKATHQITKRNTHIFIMDSEVKRG